MKPVCHTFDLRLRDTFATTHSASQVRRNYILEMVDGTGPAGDTLRGFGEAARYYDETHEQIVADLEDFCGPRLRPFESYCTSVRSAIETAKRDSDGSARGLRFDGSRADAPPSPPVATSFTLGQAEPEVMRRKAEAAAADGWRILKVKVGTPHDEENVRLIRDILPDAEIRLDANGAWDLPTALEVIPRLARFRPSMIEQPMPPGDPAAYRKLRDNLPPSCLTPIYADESTRTPADVDAHAGCIDGIVVKLVKCGGPSAVEDCIRAARRHGMAVMIGCMIESSVGITAAAHLAHLCDSADLDGHLLIANDPFAGVTLRDGRLHLPEGLGLGVRRR
jgi:L-alanine-DL-glutamate epimerase-like enolase superfamily enzyme